MPPDERRIGAGLRSLRGFRAAVFGGTDRQAAKDMAAEAPAVGVADMVDPALDTVIQLSEADLAGVICRQPRTQPPVGGTHLSRLDQAVGGMDDEAEPGIPAPTGSACAFRG